MKVSFLVTYYNQAKYVRQSLDSILAVEKPCDWEILVGDDGSSDGTVDIVNEYINNFPSNIRLFVMPREKEVQYFSVLRASANRINLLEHSAGDFFCILDGDDFYRDTQFLKIALEIFAKEKNVSVVAFNHQMLFENGHTKANHLKYKTFSNITAGRYLKKSYTHAGACVFLHGYHSAPAGKQTWERIKDVGYYDDNDIVLAALNIGKMHYVDRCIYSYRQVKDSCMNSMDKLEVHALNCLGYDEEIVISPNYKKYLKQRYFNAIFGLWSARNEVRLSLKKYEQYNDLSRKLPASITYKILNYYKCPLFKRACLDLFVICNVLKRYPRFILSKIKHLLCKG